MGYYGNVGTVTGNVYIGTHAGAHMEEAIRKSEKSIHLISPYVGETYLKLLAEKQREGVSVQGLFQEVKTQLHREKAGVKPGLHVRDDLGLRDVITSIVRFQKIPLLENKAVRKKQIQIAHMMMGVVICLMAALLALFALEIIMPTEGIESLQALQSFVDIVRNSVSLEIRVYVFGLMLVLLAIAKDKEKHALRIPTIKYHFEPVVNLRMVKKYAGSFVHLKLLIVDEEVAFLGSLNLTYSGLNQNVESCVEISDQDTVQKLLQICQEIQERTECYQIHDIGKYYYGEYGYDDGFPT